MQTNSSHRPQQFTERLDKALALRCWTKTRLADALKLSASTVSRWYGPSGSAPMPETIQKVAEALNVRHAWLSIGAEPMEETPIQSARAAEEPTAYKAEFSSNLLRHVIGALPTEKLMELAQASLAEAQQAADPVAAKAASDNASYLVNEIQKRLTP